MQKIVNSYFSFVCLQESPIFRNFTVSRKLMEFSLTYPHSGKLSVFGKYGKKNFVTLLFPFLKRVQKDNKIWYEIFSKTFLIMQILLEQDMPFLPVFICCSCWTRCSLLTR